MDPFDLGVLNNFDLSKLEIKTAPPPPTAYSFSDTQFEIIKKYVLDKEHDVGLMLTHFGSSILMEVAAIGYEKSVLMVFTGLVNGRKATLIQHINQLNFLLTSVPKDPELPKRKIGFTANWAAE